MQTMKVISFLSALLTVCSGSIPNLDALHAITLRGIEIQPLSNFPANGSSCNAVQECLSCDTARICMPGANGLEQIATINCEETMPGTPFCNINKGLCSASPNEYCQPSQEKFTCPLEDGVYPDPLSCKRYHICVNRIDTTIPCPTNNVYDHSQGECKLQRSTSDCVTFNCVRKEGQDVTYPKDDTIWGTCANGRAYILGRCESYERYDTVNRNCSRVCRAVGNQPHDTKCERYVRCSESAPGRYQMTEYPCPPSQGFDETVSKCTSEAACLKEEKPKESEDVKEEGQANGESVDKTVLGNGGEENNKSLGLLINNSGNNNSEVTNGNDDINGTVVNGNNNNNNGNTGNVGSGSQNQPSIFIAKSAGNAEEGNNRSVALLINNSGDNNNNVSNGNDAINGTVVNGNDNSGNANNGNVGSGSQNKPSIFIVNSAGNNNQNNAVENGNDNVEGALVNGNGNNIGTGTLSGRTGIAEEGNNRTLAVLINNSGNGNNHVSNGDDVINGTVVNGNDNAGNGNTGNIGNGSQNKPSIFIVNSAGNSNRNNSVENGNDNVEGALVNGNGNNIGTGTLSGRTGNAEEGNNRTLAVLINNSGNGNNHVSNGDDAINGTVVNGNDNTGNGNSGNVGNGSQNKPSIFIVNSAGNSNRNNSVENGNDNVEGALVNGNGNNISTGNPNGSILNGIDRRRGKHHSSESEESEESSDSSKSSESSGSSDESD